MPAVRVKVTRSRMFGICSMENNNLLTEVAFLVAYVNRVKGLFRSEGTASRHQKQRGGIKTVPLKSKMTLNSKCGHHSGYAHRGCSNFITVQSIKVKTPYLFWTEPKTVQNQAWLLL